MDKYMIIVTPIDIDNINLKSKVFTTSLDVNEITTLLSNKVKNITIPNYKETIMVFNEVVYDIKHPRPIVEEVIKVEKEVEEKEIIEVEEVINYCKGITFSGMDCNQEVYKQNFCYQHYTYGNKK